MAKRKDVGGSGLETGKEGKGGEKKGRWVPDQVRDDGVARIQAGRHRRVQVARTGGRKLFGKTAQAVFLEWFAATCNVKWAAEKAGFNYKTVLRHRMNDPVFAEGWDRAMRQGYVRLEAKRLETKKQETPLGIEGDWDAPEMDAMEPARMDAILRERGRELETGVRRQGRRPRIASNAEVEAELLKALKAFEKREAPATSVIASEARQTSAGLPRRFAPRNDEGGEGAPRDDEGGE